MFPYRFIASRMLISVPVGIDPCKLETGLGKQRPVLVFGSFFAAGNQQHDQIEELAAERFVAGRNDAFDDKQFAVRMTSPDGSCAGSSATSRHPNRG